MKKCLIDGWKFVQKKKIVDALVSCLNCMKTDGKERILPFILAMLESSAANVLQDNVNAAYDQLKSELKVSNYLFDNMSDKFKNEFFNIIEKGMNNYQICFNDSILLLCHSIDSKRLSNILAKITQESLTSKHKTSDYKYLFFKTKLLNSNVWSMMNDSNNDNDHNNTINNNNINANSSNENKDEDEKQEANNDKNRSSLFETIEKNVISVELTKQQEFIKQEIIKLKQQFSEQYTTLKHNIKEYNLDKNDLSTQKKLESRYRHDKDYMKDKGIKSDYLHKDMPFDNVNGFDGVMEYDVNGYLTKLLVRSHNLNALFQKDCQQLFEEDLGSKQNVSCVFREAPAKTRKRCIMKAKMDYYFGHRTM